MKRIKHFVSEYLYRVILIYLLGSFIFSCIISYRNEIQATVNRKELINYAQKYLHDPIFIRRGVELDCSGYTHTVFKRFKTAIPRTSSSQSNLSETLEDIPEMADLVFFKTDNKAVGHVGIYIGENIFIHSPGVGKEVRKDSLSNPYYYKRYMGALNVFLAKNINFE